MVSGRDQTGGEHPHSRGRAMSGEQAAAAARRITTATGRPVVGAGSVMLHGGMRATADVDIHSADRWETHRLPEAAGIMRDSVPREHRLHDVPVHMISDHLFGGPPTRVSTVDGVRVILLADLARVKLELGMTSLRRSGDLTHVLDLIQAAPLGKEFATKPPPKIRRAFGELLDEVHGPKRTTVPPRAFLTRHATTPRRPTARGPRATGTSP